MVERHGVIGSANHWLHRYFLWILLAAYAVAGLIPRPGLQLRSIRFAQIQFWGESTPVNGPLLLLAFLLFNAGLGVRLRKVLPLLKDPRLLGLGLLANFLVPILFIYFSGALLRFWPDVNEAQTIILGLTFVAAMPIAGSSAAWSQQNDGDLGLSLGLIVASTLLSPWITPLVLHSVTPMLDQPYVGALHALEQSATGSLLGLFVMLPALLGILISNCFGAEQIEWVKPALKLATSICLLILIYANAALSLPGSLRNPDLDFIVLIGLTVIALCSVCFMAGWVIARLWKTDATHEAALMFGLGMNNNGAGLALASVLLAGYPAVTLPIIIYNLVQHLAAGVVSRRLRRPSSIACA